MPHQTRVLILDAPGAATDALRHLLATTGHDTVEAHAVDAAIALLSGGGADVALVGLRVAGIDGIARLAGGAAGAHLIIQADDAEGPEAREALRLGAFDVLPRTDTFDAILQSVERAALVGQLVREVTTLRARVGEQHATTLVGRSPAMDLVRELVGRAAASRVTVLVTGEAGTGKDLVARLIHVLSDRSDRPYLTVRCQGTDSAVVEAELFGVPAATDQPARAGLFEQARGGTLVLDGYPELPRALRARISEVMARRTIERVTVTGVEQVPVDVRIVLSARDLEGDPPSCTSDDELLRRFSVLPIALPPLRERQRDIPLLVEHFRARYVSATHPAADFPDMLSLIGRRWPGNVGELEQFVERIAYQPMAEPAGKPESGAARDMLEEGLSLEAVERRYILLVLEAEDGNQSKAADRLGIDRRTLYRKLKQYRDEVGDLRLAM